MLPKRYAILERLAVGGMGEVFLARQVGVGGFQRAVVLKRLLPNAEEDDDALRRMLDEARIIGALSHENVVSIIEVGEDDESPYLALEYVHGDNAGVLRGRANKRHVEVPIIVAATIVVDAARGLQHAHGATGLDGKPLHVIHRDIAPKNLFIRDDGVTKVGDFGIARADDRLAHTATGAVAGTLSYMSPEQLQNHALDGASDQFSLGVVLWELLTAKRLYKGDGPVETATKILTEEVLPPSVIRPAVTRGLDRICMRMLERDPGRRYPSMQAVVDAIELTLPESSGQGGHRAVADLLDQMVGKELRERRIRIEEGAERTLTEGASAWPSAASSPSNPAPTGSSVVPTDTTTRDRRAADTIAIGGAIPSVETLSLHADVDGTGAGMVTRPPHVSPSAVVPALQVPNTRRWWPPVLVVIAVAVVVVAATQWNRAAVDEAPTTESLTRSYLATAVVGNPIAFEAAVRTDAEQAGVPKAAMDSVMPILVDRMRQRLSLLSAHWQRSASDRAAGTKDLVQRERALEAEVIAALRPLGAFAAPALDLWAGDASSPVGFLAPKPMTTVQAQLLDRGLAWVKNTDADRVKNVARLAAHAGLDEQATLALLQPLMAEQVGRIERFAAADAAAGPALWTAVADVERDALQRLQRVCVGSCQPAAVSVIIEAAFADIDEADEWQPQYEPLPSERGKE
jgi:serine/threonine protein kinase